MKSDTHKNEKDKKGSTARRERGQGSLYFNKSLHKWQGKLTIAYSGNNYEFAKRCK